MLNIIGNEISLVLCSEDNMIGQTGKCMRHVYSCDKMPEFTGCLHNTHIYTFFTEYFCIMKRNIMEQPPTSGEPGGRWGDAPNPTAAGMGGV
jgi:hypothetical protein